ncbi:MAG: GNAT family N-acetyltransferase [Thaumarchaeota archaeon]|nr:GNAT family N-acetyltransferase [Nitrososphaerota archaeon]
MKILEHDELPSNMEADLQLLRLSVGWVPRDFARMEEARKAGYPSADYLGLYAVEDGRILSTARVVRVPYTFPDGHKESVSGILSVITREDARGRGLATKLLTEIQDRERKKGIKLCLLWTDRSISAHGLYESMGYKDVYAPDFATKRAGKKTASPKGYELRKAEEGDLPEMVAIYEEANRMRMGFTPRPRGLLPSIVKFGLVGTGSFRMIIKGGRPVGYLDISESSAWVKVSEVAMSEGSASELVPLVEAISTGKWVTFWNTFVRDSKATLRSRGYVTSNFDNHILMGLRLDRPRAKDLPAFMGTSDDRFVCQVIDYF